MSLPQLITAIDLNAFGLESSAKTDAMIEDATAQAILVAPCLSGVLDEAQTAATKAILRAAILRWSEAGSGALQTQQAGPFSATVDTSQQRRGVFWPSEITALQRVCRKSPTPIMLDMGGMAFSPHLPWCDVMLSGLACSCGASLAGAPIYELGDQ